jgi:hypothetical protein
MSWFSNVVLHRARGSSGMPAILNQQARSLRQEGRRKVTGRDALLLHMPKGGHGVEIGVWRGEFSRILLERLQPQHLTLVDPWPSPDVAPIVYPGEVADKSAADDIYAFVVSEFGADPRVSILRKASLEAVSDFPDRSLDWVYVDGLHFVDDVRADLKAWTPKLKPGGVICGDDYYWRDDKGHLSVKQAVDEFIAERNPAAWFTFRGQFLIKPA